MNDRTCLITAAKRLEKMAEDVEVSRGSRGAALDRLYPRLRRLKRRLSFLILSSLIKKRAMRMCPILDNDDCAHSALDAMEAKIAILEPVVEVLQRRSDRLKKPVEEVARELRHRAERLRAIGPRVLQGIPESKKPLQKEGRRERR